MHAHSNKQHTKKGSFSFRDRDSDLATFGTTATPNTFVFKGFLQHPNKTAKRLAGCRARSSLTATSNTFKNTFVFKGFWRR